MATVHPSRMGLVPKRQRSRSLDRHGNDNNGPSSSRKTERRASPAYDDYRRPPPPPPSEPTAPWRQPENMYPNRRADVKSTEGIYNKGGQGGGSDFMESRRLQREGSSANVWPPSPKAPARSLSPKRRSKRSKRERSPSTSDSSSEEERRKREKRRRKKEKEREKEEKRERRRHRSRSRGRYSDDEEDRRRHRQQSRSLERPSRRSESRKHSDDEWVVKSPARPASPPHALMQPPPPPPRQDEFDSDDDGVGPQPVYKPNTTKRLDERSYGGALLRGEGSAMAAWLQEGGTDARIPRRGEIGLTPDEIAKYEDVGYVMSGSRHRRMNAVRMRKENQVISAEEKRGILKLQREERERREAILREEFNELVNERLKGSDVGPPPPT
ncbi:DUF926-domain-containing protein [Hymenopellis radicata]|nr:DUF926-domain-containing protein [Hymenopellis radicata]